jgi:spermidine synthase
MHIHLANPFIPKIIETVTSDVNGQIVVYKDQTGIRLSVGGLTQSGRLIEIIWEKPLAQLKKYPVGSILIIGLGGGSILKLTHRFWPKAEVTGIEIDPRMIDLGKKYLGLNADDKPRIILGDAYRELPKLPQKFDLILIDAYRGEDRPKAMQSSEFVRQIYRHLTLGGLAVFNFVFHDEKTKASAGKDIHVIGLYAETKLVRVLANLLVVTRQVTRSEFAA